MSAPTPCSSPPPLSPAESTNSHDPIETRRAASAPPLPEEVADEFGYTAEMRASISPCLLSEAARPPLNGGKPCKLPIYRAPTPEEDTVSLFRDTELEWNRDERGASGWEDLYMGDDGYVIYQLISYTPSNSFLECAATEVTAAVGDIGTAQQYKIACSCKNRSSCTCNVPVDWLVDSSATMHISPNKSDFIDLTSSPNEQPLKTADGNTTLIIRGRGTVLIQHVFQHKGETRTELL